MRIDLCDLLSYNISVPREREGSKNKKPLHKGCFVYMEITTVYTLP